MVAPKYSATSHLDFPFFQDQYGSLTPRQLQASGSKATEAHLPYLRLVVTGDNNTADILPTFTEDHNRTCPLCQNTPPTRRQRIRFNYAMQDIPIKTLMQKSLAEFDKMRFAEFWTALTHCWRAAYPQLDNSYNLRQPASPKPPPDFLNTLTSVQQDSSSPARPASSSSFSADHDFDEDAFANLRNVSENPTNLLAYMTDRFALYCLLQPGPTHEIRPRAYPVRYTARIGSTTVTTYDDGGLDCFEKTSGVWRKKGPPVAIRETKIASDEFTYEQCTSKIFPVITNKILAQYLLEVVTAMRANPTQFLSRIILVAHVGIYSRLFHFYAGPQYHPFLNAKSDKDRQALTDKYPEDTCIYMTSTRWLYLPESGDRGLHFCNVFCIVRAYTPQPPSPSDADADADDDEDDDDDDDGENDGDGSTASQILPIITNTTKGKRKRPDAPSSDSISSP